MRREEPFLSLAGAETPADHPLVRAAEEAGGAPAEGAAYCTDAARLNGEGGDPFVVSAPASIELGAHGEHEWVGARRGRRAVDVYVSIARGFRS